MPRMTGGRYLGEALKQSGGLTHLSLSWNGLMDRGARAIGEGLASNGALTTLDVRATSLVAHPLASLDPTYSLAAASGHLAIWPSDHR